jgi:hypothetical protein
MRVREVAQMAGASKKWATGNGPAMLGRAFAVLIFVMSTIAAAAAGCGADSNKPTGSGGSGSTTGSGPGGSTSSIPNGCLDGAIQDCHVTLAQHGSVITCYAGTQTCAAGLWGDCIGGSEFHRLVPGTGSVERRDPGAAAGDTVGEPEAPVFHTDSLTDAGACPDAGFNDPCDPTCMGYPEVPDGGVAITGVGNPGWVSGSIGTLPPGLLGKAVQTPCYSASDCQLNEYCGNPATKAACSHNKCAAGTPLTAACDPCVQQICAKPANAACCASATCAHDICAVGAKLASACDPCVNSICSTNPLCCSSTWDATCVGLVASQCGLTCKTWGASCVQEVHDTCGDFCDPPKAAACVHDVCYSGDPLANGCDNAVPGGNCVANVCALRPSCCTTAWDATCVSLIPSACTPKTCAQQGVCDPWLAGQTDPSCPKADLTLGVPCNNAGVTQIPVCNVGTVTATPPPGGIIVHHWPGNSSGMPTCSPNLATGADCLPGLMTPIPPGQCVMLNCPLSGNDELMVNPSATVNECTCQNNWGLYSSSSTCESTVCTGAQTNLSTTNIVWHIGMERSVATAAAIAPATTVLAQVKQGLLGFYGAPVNATAHGTLTFFPDSPTAPATQPDCNTTTCTSATSCTSRVTMNLLNSSLFTTALGPTTTSAAGGPPTSAAYDGMITTAIPFTSLATYVNDTHVAVLVLSSDVANCNPSVTALATAAANALSVYKIRTFVIGVGVPTTTTAAIAAAGGGTAFDFVANASLGANITLALNSIRQNLFPCTFPLPPAGQFDPSNPAVTYVSGAPGPIVVAPQTQVTNLLGCLPTGGFYYDNNLNPTQVILCPAVCTAHQNTLYSGIKLVISCPTKYMPWTAPPQIYQGVCPPGTLVQWSLFGYDATTLSTSNVVFSVQAAMTQAGLAGAPVVPLAVAQSTPTDTQVCPVPKIPAQIPAPTCAPIDLYAKLGLTAARYSFLQLNMAFNPNALQTVTPTVSDWQMTYSCVADQ